MGSRWPHLHPGLPSSWTCQDRAPTAHSWPLPPAGAQLGHLKIGFNTLTTTRCDSNRTTNGQQHSQAFHTLFSTKTFNFPRFLPPFGFTTRPQGHTTYATTPLECATFRPHHHQTAVSWPSPMRACRGLGRQTFPCTYCRRMTLSVWCSPDSCSTTHLKSISDYSIPPAPSGLRHYTTTSTGLPQTAWPELVWKMRKAICRVAFRSFFRQEKQVHQATLLYTTTRRVSSSQLHQAANSNFTTVFTRLTIPHPYLAIPHLNIFKLVFFPSCPAQEETKKLFYS